MAAVSNSLRPRLDTILLYGCGGGALAIGILMAIVGGKATFNPLHPVAQMMNRKEAVALFAGGLAVIVYGLALLVLGVRAVGVDGESGVGLIEKQAPENPTDAGGYC